MLSKNEIIYDELMAQGKRAEADAYAEENTEEDFESPVECIACDEVFESENSFVTKPYRAVCTHCGQIQPVEHDWDYYIEY